MLWYSPLKLLKTLLKEAERRTADHVCGPKVPNPPFRTPKTQDCLVDCGFWVPEPPSALKKCLPATVTMQGSTAWLQNSVFSTKHLDRLEMGLELICKRYNYRINQGKQIPVRILDVPSWPPFCRYLSGFPSSDTTKRMFPRKPNSNFFLLQND